MPATLSPAVSRPSFARWWFDEAPPIGPSIANHHEAVEAVLAKAAEKDTLEEAIRFTIHGLTGSDVHTVVAQAESKCVFRMGDVVAWVGWSPRFDAERWDNLLDGSSPLAGRATHLRLVLNADSFVSSHTPHQTLAAPWEGMWWKPLVTAAALSMWWHDQMAAGATPEAARTLLNLLLPFEAVPRVHLTEDGQTPVYTGLPSNVYGGHATTYHPCPREVRR